MESLHTMIQIKALHTMKMCCFKYISVIRWPCKREQIAPQTTTNTTILSTAFFLVTSCLSSFLKSSCVCPTVLNVFYAKVASPIKFLLKSNRISLTLFSLIFIFNKKPPPSYLLPILRTRWRRTLKPKSHADVV